MRSESCVPQEPEAGMCMAAVRSVMIWLISLIISVVLVLPQRSKAGEQLDPNGDVCIQRDTQLLQVPQLISVTRSVSQA